LIVQLHSERERESDREGEREKEIDTHNSPQSYKVSYVVVSRYLDFVCLYLYL